MSIDNELLRSLCDHPATGRRLVEYVVTGDWNGPEGSGTVPTAVRRLLTPKTAQEPC